MAEYLFCLKKNLALTILDEVILLVEGKAALKNIHLSDKKLKVVLWKNRPTFKDVFTYLSEITQEDDINIIANSDIYYDETLVLVERITHADFFALSRNDIKVKKDSQDTWIFRGSNKAINYGDYYFGILGCDNKIAYEMSKFYQVTNPCRSIRSYHVHKTRTKHDRKKMYSTTI